MRILTWNCQGAFQNKSTLLTSEKPDLAIIQECSRASLLTLPDGYTGLWLSGDEKRGLGLMYRTCFEVERTAEPHAHWLTPLIVHTTLPLRIVAVWTVKTPDKTSYVEQVMSCMDSHPEWFVGETLVTGDFNSNQIWDTTKRPLHAAMVERFAADGLISAYHGLSSEGHGKEQTPTFYQNRKSVHGYHLDYIFMPSTWLPRVQSLTVGQPGFWLKHSDHCPLMLTLR